MKRISIHHELSNGQIASIYFNKKKYIDTKEVYWEVGFIIGKRKRANNDWYEDKGSNKAICSTGRCNLEGLVWAKYEIMAFMYDHRMDGIKQHLEIDGSDDRRVSAYKRLCKQVPELFTFIEDIQIIRAEF